VTGGGESGLGLQRFPLAEGADFPDMRRELEHMSTPSESRLRPSVVCRPRIHE
jgi:hypothetical protein